MVSSLNVTMVEIKADNKQVIQLCVPEDAPPWECSSIIADMARHTPLSFSWCSKVPFGKQN